MLTIRLTRVGKKKQPSYRVVVQEKQRDPWGTSIEILGNYNPRTKALVVKADRITHWIAQGAQPSPTMHNLLVTNKIIEGKKVRNTTGDRKPQEAAEKKAAEAPSAAEAPAEEAKTGENAA